MKLSRYIAAFSLLALTTVSAMAQERSTTTGVSRTNAAERRRALQQAGPGITQRMQNASETTPMSDADLDWMRVIYRELDLNKVQNAPLYYPDEVIDGQKNLFRIIMELVASGQLPVYEYLDGREIFNDQYRVKTRDMLDRFHILYTDAKGSTEKRPRFTIEDADVPSNEVLSYYIIERWEFDHRTNKVNCHVEAVCPVLHRSGDFGGEAVKYPMFWVKYSDIKPYLATTSIFVDDNNNLATHSISDYFSKVMYDGEIYKTRNLRNLSLMQMYSDPDRRKQVQDSIQQSLDNWGKKMWVPSLEELEEARIAREEAEAAAENGPTTATAPVIDSEGLPVVAEEGAQTEEAPKVNSRARKSEADKKKADSKKKKSKKKPKVKRAKSSGTQPAAEKSVRNRRR